LPVSRVEGSARVLQCPLWASCRVRVEVRGDINSILYYRSPWTLANFGEGIVLTNAFYFNGLQERQENQIVIQIVYFGMI
jgi:hypothetical protein